MNTDNTFYKLTQSSPLLEHIREKNHSKIQTKEFNIEDSDNNIEHIALATEEIRDDHYAEIKYALRNNHVDALILKYSIDQNGAACLTYHDKNNTIVKIVYIHDLYMKAEIEEIFKIKFSTEINTLGKTNDKSIGIRVSNALKNKHHLPPHSKVISDVINNGDLILYTPFMDTFKAGVNHIKHIHDATKDYQWLRYDEQGEIGKKYKHLYLEDENWFKLHLFNLDEMYNCITEYYFSLELEFDMIDTSSYFELENELLFEQLMPFCRQKRLKDLIKFL